MACHQTTAAALAWAEHDFIHISGHLADLAEVLNRCSAKVPKCARAARQVKRLRRMLEVTLTQIDMEITAAVQAAGETDDNIPF